MTAISAEAEVVEIAVDDRYTPNEDIRLKVRWTGSGDRPYGDDEWLTVRKDNFGQTGVDRVQSLLLAALTNQKTLWIVFDESDANHYIKRVYLKASRNE